MIPIATKEYYQVLDIVHDLEQKYNTKRISEIPDFEFKKTREIMKMGTPRGRPTAKYNYEFIDFQGNSIALSTSMIGLSDQVKMMFIDKRLSGYSAYAFREALDLKQGKTKLGYILKSKL